MQASGRPRVEVVIDGRPKAMGGPTGQRLRPLTADEALQYSPLTTSVITGYEQIPMPDLAQAGVSFNLLADHERSSSRMPLSQNIDVPVKGGAAGSWTEDLKKGLNEILDPDDLPEFNFKPLHLPFLCSRSSSTSGQAVSKYQPRLSPLARTLLDSSDIAFHYPSPVPPDEKTSADVRLPLIPTSSVLGQRSIAQQNRDSFLQNSETKIVKPEILVEVPPRPPYKYAEGARNAPEKQKLNGEQHRPKAMVQYHAQKEEAEAAMLKFGEFLCEIFDAFDRIDPENPTSSAQQASQYFEEPDSLDDTTARLSTKIHSKLQNAIKKLVAGKKFVQIPTDDVKRLQKICEEPVLLAQTINLQPAGEPTDEDVGHWQTCLKRVENGLTSACTISWTILGSLESKERCAEDLVQCIPVLLTNVFEMCLVPIIESRSTGRTSALFRAAQGAKQLLTRLLHQGRKLLSLMADICLLMESNENAITRIEYLATQLIFAESSSTEKDSVLGVQPFEAVRKTAMEVLAKIFSKFANQRQSILDEILSSLQKLSTMKQGARQFKLVDGKNIQLVSALVMSLVQTVACDTSEQTHGPKTGPTQQRSQGQTISGVDEEDSDDESASSDEEPVMNTQPLGHRARLLHQKALESANYIMNYFVQRAKVSSKTGDQPHRNLLDLFAEDLISVLGSPGWPAAETLLWILARHMLTILNDEKSAATPKNMALELLGWMGSAITNLLLQIQSLSESFSQADDSLSQYLSDLARDQLKDSTQIDDIVTETGPFRVTLEYLCGIDQGNWQIQTAQGFYFTIWIQMLSSHVGDKSLNESGSMAKTLLRASSGSHWLEKNTVFGNISAQHARLAYLLTVMNMNFCKTFDVILNVLLHSLTSDQAKIRSRSLKSVIAMLEADPKLLDRDIGIMKVIFRCASDPSPMVRDNALSLIAKCMSLRPGWEEEATRVILDRGQSDVATGVRKRCIAILKEIYLRNPKTNVRAEIARSFLHRLSDPEETVALLAKQALFDIWISPFVSTSTIAVDNAKAQVALSQQVHLIVKAVNTSDHSNHSELLPPLEQFVRKMLEDSMKTGAPVSILCSNIVDLLFDMTLNNSDPIPKQEQRALLCTLQAFAKAKSTLIKPEQLQALQPYIQNLSSDDDLFFFRSVVVIYRCVLPYSSDKVLLKAIQNDLMRAVSKLGRGELNEAIACLWTIDRVLCNTERLVKLTMSLLKNIHATKLPRLGKIAETRGVSGDEVRRLRSYLRITGCMGKHCDLEPFTNSFREMFPSWKGSSVAGLMVDLINPLTTSESPPSIRTEAVHSLASICQSWPGQFNREIVRRSISDVFEGGDSDLQRIILVSFLEFFKARELAAENLTAVESHGGKNDGGRLESSLKASDHDGAAALIAQHFLAIILQLSVSGNEEVDMPSAQVIASITRQGLVHPKECAGVLVALETSPRPLLAQIACESHRLLHQRHETMLEREYVRAIREAYVYQRDVVKDPAGAKSRPFLSKLASLYEMVKTSNVKYVRKFLTNLAAKVSMDLADVKAEKDLTDQVLFSRFIVQNLGYFEYGRLDELASVIAFMESQVGKSGGEVAQAIEGLSSEDTSIRSTEDQTTTTVTVTTTSKVGTSMQLRHLTTAAMMLTMLWEVRTHLRRQYGITETVREVNGKGKDAKELAKAPTKVHGITGERFWDKMSEIMASLDHEAAMLSRCHAFAELMAVDDEVRVAAEADEMRDTYSASVDREPSLQPPMNVGKTSSSKRKSSSVVTGTPKKKRGRPSLNGKRRQSANLESNEESN